MVETDTTLSLATKLATSYVGNNTVARSDLPALIGSLHEALAKLADDGARCRTGGGDHLHVGGR